MTNGERIVTIFTESLKLIAIKGFQRGCEVSLKAATLEGFAQIEYMLEEKNKFIQEVDLLIKNETKEIKGNEGAH